MEVILYSNNCPQCRVLEVKLKEKKIDFTEVNDIDLMLKKGLRTMPALEVDSEMMNFASALKWLGEK